MKNTKILSLLLVALFGASYSSANNTKVLSEATNNENLIVRHVLRQNAANEEGTIINETSAPLANNLVSDVLAQVNTPSNGKISMRFVAGIDTYSYSNAQFNITLKNSEGEVVKAERSYSVSSAYIGVEASGEVKYASDLFGEGYNYLIAYTLSGIPEDYWNYQFDVTASIGTEGSLTTSENVKTKVASSMLDVNLKVNLFNVDGSLIETRYEKVATNEIYTYNAPSVDGLVASHDYVKGYLTDSKMETVNIYYSEVDVWDGESVSASLSGEGTEENPFLIQSGADLAYFSNEVNNGNTYEGSFVKMTKSIDLEASTNFMIGSSSTNSFSGTFDGNNCSIRNLNVSRTATRTGLFYELLGSAVVKNISTYGSFNGGQYTGSIAGYLTNTSLLDNCTNYADVSIVDGKNNIGGVAGGMNNDSVIDNCTNYGNVIALDTTANVGGITSITWTSTSEIKNSKNFGNVTGGTQGTEGTYGTGGIIGTNKSLLTNNKNYGYITSTKNNVGGIAGYSTAAVDNGQNYGEVSGATYVGGVVGNSTKGIDNSVNYGIVSAPKYVGGIAGKTTSSITKSTNAGEVSGATERTGGIVGHSEGSISYCVNDGNVTGGNYTGGIAGTTATLTIDHCVNNGKVVGTSNYTGGIAGCITSGKTTTITNCTNNGEVYNASYNGVAGILGGGIGNTSVSNISNCENLGTVYGNGKVGGIVGYYRTGTIENCVNNGSVSGKNDVHDLVGYNWSGTQDW